MSTEKSQRPVWLGEDQRRWDHVRVHVCLLKDPRLGAEELAVYIGLAAHAELASGRSFPSQATLGAYAGLSDRTVRRVIDVLVEALYLRVEERPGKANVYVLLPPPRTEIPGSPDTGSEVPRTEGASTPDRGSDELEVTRSIEPKRLPHGLGNENHKPLGPVEATQAAHQAIYAENDARMKAERARWSKPTTGDAKRRADEAREALRQGLRLDTG